MTHSATVVTRAFSFCCRHTWSSRRITRTVHPAFDLWRKFGTRTCTRWVNTGIIDPPRASSFHPPFPRRRSAVCVFFFLPPPQSLRRWIFLSSQSTTLSLLSPISSYVPRSHRVVAFASLLARIREIRSYQRVPLLHSETQYSNIIEHQCWSISISRTIEHSFRLHFANWRETGEDRGYVVAEACQLGARLRLSSSSCDPSATSKESTTVQSSLDIHVQSLVGKGRRD